MAQTIRPEAVAAALARHLQPGELLRHAVYGREVSIGKLMLVMLGSLIPAALIAYAMVGPPDGLLSWLTYSLLWGGFMTWPITKIAKDYIVALTDRRLLLVNVQTPVVSIDLNKQKSTLAWPLVQAPPLNGQAGKMFAKLVILTPQRPVRMKIGYVGQSGAKFQTEAIISIVASLRGPGIAGPL